MTSAASESVATILCNSKQTRFQITNHREVSTHINSSIYHPNANHQQLDIDGVNITVTSGDKPTAKGKTKGKGEGIEILAGAKLRLKEGQRYALVGRNGTGKSSESMSVYYTECLKC
jgi:ABC-type glutathione transport system ATPase component